MAITMTGWPPVSAICRTKQKSSNKANHVIERKHGIKSTWKSFYGQDLKKVQEW